MTPKNPGAFFEAAAWGAVSAIPGGTLGKGVAKVATKGGIAGAAARGLVKMGDAIGTAGARALAPIKTYAGKAWTATTAAWTKSGPAIKQMTSAVKSKVSAVHGALSARFYKTKLGAFVSSAKTKVFQSKIFGVGSKPFGNSTIRNAPPSLLNRPGGLIKLGWSTTPHREGGWALRLGIGRSSNNPNQSLLHINVPFTRVPYSIADEFNNALRLKNMGKK